jgi:leucyl/phenylalanyl-tRNA--protein transferase
MPPLYIPPHPKQFPDMSYADDDGLIAYGGDLSPNTLILAYKNGIFPWYNEDEHTPILWWSPEPRCVISPHLFTVSRSLKKTLKSERFTITVDSCFTQVVRACAAPRSYAKQTWINEKIINSYSELHQQGIAHSIETWNQEGELVGGLYGLNLGHLFFGESMFSTESDASKVAFAFLMHICASWNFPLVDCQLPNEHLMSLGAYTMPRTQFLATLQTHQQHTAPDWRLIQTMKHRTIF